MTVVGAAATTEVSTAAQHDAAEVPVFANEEVLATGTVAQAPAAAAVDASADHSAQLGKKRKMSKSKSGATFWRLQAAYVLAQHLCFQACGLAA